MALFFSNRFDGWRNDWLHNREMGRQISKYIYVLCSSLGFACEEEGCTLTICLFVCFFVFFCRELDAASLVHTNYSTAKVPSSASEIHVRSILHGRGDAGYLLTSSTSPIPIPQTLSILPFMRLSLSPCVSSLPGRLCLQPFSLSHTISIFSHGLRMRPRPRL